MNKLLNQIRNWFRRHWRWLTLAVLALVFFIGTSGFNYYSQSDGYIKWLSPDETANYIFAKLYGQAGRLTIFEKYNLAAGDTIHPRSMRSDDGAIKPVSFLGLILIYGSIVSLTSYKVLPYLTPWLAAAGIIYYYLLIKKIFGRSNAYLSAWLLAVFPVYLYYSARSLFHNVLFVVLLIMGFYYCLLLARPGKKKGAADNPALTRAGPVAADRPNQPITDDSLAGAAQAAKKRNFLAINWPGLAYAASAGGFIGLATSVRSSELLWLLPVLLTGWLFNLKKVGLTKLIIFICFAALALLPVLYWNQILFGAVWRGGYPAMNQSIKDISQAGGNFFITTASGRLSGIKELLLTIRDNVFYFGWQPLKSATTFYDYFPRLFYWLFWPAALGAVLFVKNFKKWKTRHLVYGLSLLILSLILVFYYGSWQINDNPDPEQITIGNSYTRYWLPIYLGFMPLASMFIIRLTRILKRKNLIRSARRLIVLIIVFISLNFVLYQGEEGLLPSLSRQKQARPELERLLELTEANAVIITRYHDKLLFPERKVIVGLFDDKKLVKRYASLAGLLPLYYYNFTLPAQDLDYLNQKRLGEAGLAIAEVARVTGDFTLYRLRPAGEVSQSLTADLTD